MADALKSKRVIVNGDDFGFSPGVTEGILCAADGGILTSTTITANMPAARDAIARIRGRALPGLGVHLNVSQGPALSPAGREMLSGENGSINFSGLRLLKALTLRPSLLDAVEAEFDAQIRWVFDHGITPTHLDSHRHIHAFWPVFARVAKLARRYHVPYVRWFHEKLPGGGWPKSPLGQNILAKALNAFGVGMDAMDRRSPGGRLRGTNGTLGIAQTGHISEQWLMRLASSISAGTWEIMSHPGSGAADLDPVETRLLESRPAEMRALCSPDVVRAFERNGIERIHYGSL